MSSLSPKDRVSLCQFTFSDGRRCRTPRTGKNPHFCFDHAQKEARALAEESLSKDLAYFFSGDYLSACDLSTALGRLIPAVIRGDVKPKNARTVAYMAQILLQSIQISQHEYVNAFGTGPWHKAISNSVNGNHKYRFPQAPKRSGGLQAGPAPQPEHPGQPQPASPPPQPAQTPVNCHSECSEEPAFSSSPATPPKATPSSASAPPTTAGATSPATPLPQAQPPASQPVNPPGSRPSTSPREPSRDTPWWNFGDSGNIPPDSHLL